MRAESLRLTSLVDFVGSERLSVCRTVVIELSQTQFDDKRKRFEALIASLHVIDDEAESIVATAEALFAKYERHDDAPEGADAIIAAAARARVLTTSFSCVPDRRGSRRLDPPRELGTVVVTHPPNPQVVPIAEHRHPGLA